MKIYICGIPKKSKAKCGHGISIPLQVKKGVFVSDRVTFCCNGFGSSFGKMEPGKVYGTDIKDGCPFMEEWNLTKC